MKTISKDSQISEVLLPSSVPQSSLVLNPPGIYVACLYEGEWFIKFLTKQDVDVSFMKQDKLSFAIVWPQREDRCWVPKENVICRIFMLATCPWSWS